MTRNRRGDPFPRGKAPRVERWRDAHVLVTGGSSGIGRAFVRQVARLGSTVSVLALDDGDLAATADELASLGVGHVALPTDVADEGSVASAVARATGALGPCDVLLTCAGIAHPGYFEQLDDSIFRRTMEIDYFGTLYAVRAVVPAMVEHGRGSVVGISSTAGLVGVFGYSAYSPPKFAVRGLLEVLRVELRPKGIHVGCVCPPDTDTPQLAYENLFKPPETFAISGAIKPFTPERVAASIVHGMERGRFLITPDWQGQVVARTTGLAREAWFAYFDARVRTSHRTSGGAHTTREPK
ncbi:SDR family oxidoreductase [Knoellia sp. 3-2P3]|uniref:SDR family oxidoreductase n=1 Tax=unclassified Knoellia TaxID=2618719 RepID=UPI0023DB58A3|nr:SDR family oxidoreductase [Knoellia sp. 3-2P3]MDF2090998.1 SDR family oxidoreductase [Knoellia sp. 3-2P3]